MFGGSYKHTLDEAGRFVMPLKFRFSLGEKFIITKGLGCLCVFSSDTAASLEKQLAGLGDMLHVLLDPNISRLHRHFFSGMVEASCENKQFRVQLTPEHRRHAGITDEVVIRGCGDFIEIWAPAKLDEYEQVNGEPQALIESGAAVFAERGVRNAGESDAGVPSSAGTE